MSAAPTAFALLALAAAGGCRAQDTVARLSDGGQSRIDGGEARTDGGQPGYCAGSGPPILVGDHITVGGGGMSGGDVCSGEVSTRTFRFALCTCEGYAASTTLTTDSFDSSLGPFMSGGKGGSVGINGAFASNAPANVGGSLWVSGAGGVILGGGDLSVAGDLHSAGGMARGVTVSIAHDAEVGGDIDLGGLTVTGQLTVPAGRTIAVSGTRAIGQTVRAPVAVAPPCACEPADLVDITAFVALNQGVNDDASIGLSPGRLAAPAADTTLELPCGRFYLDSIGGAHKITLRATGRSALFVGGDVALQAPLVVELGAGGELDLFIGGLLSDTDVLTLGSADRPAKVRVYIGGSGTINLSGGALVAGNLYAPRAELALSGPVELYGSLFVRTLVASAPVTIHYDTHVLEAAGACPSPPPTRCGSCLDCRNQACIAGSCGVCTDSSQCCAPLVCAVGRCIPALL